MTNFSNDSLKLFKFITQVEQKKDTPELYEEINGAFETMNMLFRAWDALMYRYSDDIDNFKVAYVACGLESIMSVDLATKLLQYCNYSLSINNDQRDEKSTLFNNVVNLADQSGNEYLKHGIYVMVADSLLRGGLIGENIELANKITNYFSDKDINNADVPVYILTTIGRV